MGVHKNRCCCVARDYYGNACVRELLLDWQCVHLKIAVWLSATMAMHEYGILAAISCLSCQRRWFEDQLHMPKIGRLNLVRPSLSIMTLWPNGVQQADLVGCLIRHFPDPEGFQSRLYTNAHKIVGQGVHRLIATSIALSNQDLKGDTLSS